MRYFKTIGGMINHMLAENGAIDNNGNPVVATEKPMDEEEYAEFKKNELLPKIKNILTSPPIATLDL
jgi:hypothetical protein